ncbi:MAG: acyltransferase family protein, partial [Cellulosilyticaceae bacterium]
MKSNHNALVKTVRESNLELLRIVAILMVITLHYLNANIGGGLKGVEYGSINYYLMYFVESMCIVAVNLFVLISAYFLSEKKQVKFIKVISLLFLAWFYGGTLYILSVIIGENQFNFKEMVLSINPFLMYGYWYIKTYIILFVISPYLNIVHNNLSKKQHINLILILGFFFCLWPSFIPGAPNSDGGYGIITFCLLYFIGSYLRKYDLPKKIVKDSVWIYVCCVIVVFLFAVYGSEIKWNYNFIFNVVGAIGLFIRFRTIKIKAVWINKLASLSFAIYILHFNPSLVDFIYQKLLKCNQYYNSKYLIVHLFTSVVIIYMTCAIIECIR